MASIHKGHRERFRTRARSAGLETFEPHEVIELLLMQIIPQKDVNKLAHLLINEFGSVHAVLNADEKILHKLPGIGPKTQKWFRDAFDLTKMYACSPVLSADRITTLQEAMEYMRQRMQEGETGLLLAYLDFSGHVIHTVLFPSESKRYPAIPNIISAVLRHHAFSVLSTRINPKEYLPSEIKESDTHFASNLSKALRLVNLELIDHLFCNSTNTTSLQTEQKERIFSRKTAGSEEKRAAESAIPAPMNANIIQNIVIRDGKDWFESDAVCAAQSQQ